MSTYQTSSSDQKNRTTSGNPATRFMENLISRVFRINLSEVNVSQSELDEDLQWGQ